MLNIQAMLTHIEWPFLFDETRSLKLKSAIENKVKTTINLLQSFRNKVHILKKENCWPDFLVWLRNDLLHVLIMMIAPNSCARKGGEWVVWRSLRGEEGGC